MHDDVVACPFRMDMMMWQIGVRFTSLCAKWPSFSLQEAWAVNKMWTHLDFDPPQRESNS